MKRFAADFETTTDINDCRVWAWGVCSIDDNLTFRHGVTIDTFFDFLKENSGEYYFHNLKFDGKFILPHLIAQVNSELNGLGFSYTSEKPKSRQFTCLIDDALKFYEIKICFKKGHTVKIRDSFKKIPFALAKIAKDFGIEEQKLEINYTDYRPIGHQLTDQEYSYLYNDCVILAKALKIQFDNGNTGMTIGSDAMKNYKSLVERKFESWMPQINQIMDAHIRLAYRGGYTFCNPKFQGGIVSEGIVLDVNSMYPAVMKTKPMPIGLPKYFKGRPKEDKEYPLWVACVRMAFECKDGFIPTIQVKRSKHYNAHEYVYDSLGSVELWISSVDWELIKEHYDVEVFEWVEGYYFKQAVGIFNDYIDYWMSVKETSKGAVRALAKLMLNNLYGKFGTNPEKINRMPLLGEDLIVRYPLDKTELTDSVYTPIAVFVTSWARDKMIRSAQAVYDRFLYCDTDSLHLLGDEIPSDLEVHPTRLGAWDFENKFSQGKYLRSKCYMERIIKDETTYDQVTVAGMPPKVKEICTFENFEIGLSVTADMELNLKPKDTVGGVVLLPAPYTLHY